MGNRCNILNRGDSHSSGLESGNGRFPARSSAFDHDFQLDDTKLFSGIRTFLRCLLSGKGSALSRSLKADRSSRIPAKGFTINVRYSNQGVIKGGLNVANSLAHISSNFLFSAFFSHESSFKFLVITTDTHVRTAQHAIPFLLHCLNALFTGHSLLGTLARTSVTLCPLTANGQPTTVPQSTIAGNVTQPRDVLTDLTS